MWYYAFLLYGCAVGRLVGRERYHQGVDWVDLNGAS